MRKIHSNFLGQVFVCDDPFGQEATTFHQLDQKPLCGALVPFRLKEFLKNDAVLVDRAPEPVGSARDLQNDFVQMPDIAGRGCRRRKRWAMRGPNLTNVILKCTGTRQTIKILQVKYLNNILEQDHRFIKRITGPMMGFKAFHSACATITGIETAT